MTLNYYNLMYAKKIISQTILNLNSSTKYFSHLRLIWEYYRKIGNEKKKIDKSSSIFLMVKLYYY